jgi:hypothetical protein
VSPIENHKTRKKSAKKKPLLDHTREEEINQFFTHSARKGLWDKNDKKNECCSAFGEMRKK